MGERVEIDDYEAFVSEKSLTQDDAKPKWVSTFQTPDTIAECADPVMAPKPYIRVFMLSLQRLLRRPVSGSQPPVASSPHSSSESWSSLRDWDCLIPAPFRTARLWEY